LRLNFIHLTVPGGDLPPELEIDFMSESVDNISKRVLSNDFSSMVTGSIEEGIEMASPLPYNDGIADQELIPASLSNRNKRKKRTKLQLKTELDRDTCRQWVSL
jgi:hypothetical protein